MLFCSAGSLPYFSRFEAKGIFLAVYFVNINLPEERNQVLHPESELSELPDDSLDVFKRSKIDHYMQRPVEHPILENTIF